MRDGVGGWVATMIDRACVCVCVCVWRGGDGGCVGREERGKMGSGGF